jgi:hypothetical protein
MVVKAVRTLLRRPATGSLDGTVGTLRTDDEKFEVLMSGYRWNEAADDSMSLAPTGPDSCF